MTTFTRIYKLRLTEQERQALDQVARAEGLQAAGWLRWQIKRAYRNLQAQPARSLDGDSKGDGR